MRITTRTTRSTSPEGPAPPERPPPGVLPLGRVAGVPIGAHWSVAVTVALLAWLLVASVLPVEAPGTPAVTAWVIAVVAGVVFIAAIAAHELAHVVVARHAGIEVRRVTLWVIGGVSEMVGEPRRPRTLAAVAVAGPLVSAVLGGGFLGLAVLGGRLAWPLAITVAISWLGSTNIVLAVFNLLPAAPLDGGRVLHAVVWALTGDQERARRVAAVAGRVLGMLLVLSGALLLWNGSWSGLWLMGVGWFLSSTAAREQAGSRLIEAVAGRTVGEIMHPPALLAQAGQSAESFAAELLGHPPGEGVFPVVDLDGGPVGLITVRDLVRLAPADRVVTRVREAGHPLPAERILGMDVPVTRLLTLGPVPGSGVLAVVVDHGRIAGLVTVADVEHLAELTELAAPRG